MAMKDLRNVFIVSLVLIFISFILDIPVEVMNKNEPYNPRKEDVLKSSRAIGLIGSVVLFLFSCIYAEIVSKIHNRDNVIYGISILTAIISILFVIPTISTNGLFSGQVIGAICSGFLIYCSNKYP